jgi:hypothetical protein
MATRAYIAVQNRTSLKFSSIYCHQDGDMHLPTLETHYATPQARAALLKLGDLSRLGESTGKPEGHSFDTPVKGYCVAYHRDRGDDRHPAETFTGIVSLIDAARNADAEYLYVHQFGRWERHEL